jgi:hypothetical protein
MEVEDLNYSELGDYKSVLFISCALKLIRTEENKLIWTNKY